MHLLLEVDPTRLHGIWVSPNGVLLARAVPADAIVGVQPLTRRATACLETLERRLGLITP